MKKTLILCLIFCLLLPCFVSCGMMGQPLVEFDITLLNSWLSEIDASQVARVERIVDYGSIDPNAIEESKYSTDPDEINEFIEWCKNTKFYPTIPISTFGGLTTKYVFTFADGSVKEINASSPFYILRHPSNFTIEMDCFYRFNASDASYSIYTAGDSPMLVKSVEKGASKLSFIRYDGLTPTTEATHYIQASFGKVYFYSDTLCYIEPTYDSGNVAGYYELYKTTLSDLIG